MRGAVAKKFNIMDVSIIIPYKSDRGWLEEAYNSAKRQKFTGTFEVIKQQGPYNSATNLNNGIKKAKGTFIKKLDEDDYLPTNSIQRLYNKAIKGYDIVCSKALNIYPEEGFRQFNSIIPANVSQLALSNTIHGGSTLYRKSSLIKAGLLDENLWTGEEFELHLRMAAAGYSFGYTGFVTYFYRIHNNQKSMQGGWVSSEDYLKRKKYIHHNIVLNYSQVNSFVNINP